MKKAFIALILLVAFVGCEDMDKECETLQVHCAEYGEIPCRKWADKCYMTEDYQNWKAHQDEIIKEAAEEVAFKLDISECETVLDICMVDLDDCLDLSNKEKGSVSLAEFTSAVECKAATATAARNNIECVLKFSECTDAVTEKHGRPNN